METIKIRRLSIGSVFKINFVGMAAGIIPLILIFSIMAVFGMQTISWNGEPVTGPAALLFGPLIGLFLATIFTILLSPMIWLGLLIFSKLNKPLSISFQDFISGE